MTVGVSVILSTKMMENTGENRHLCLTPTVEEVALLVMLFMDTELFDSLQRASITWIKPLNCSIPEPPRSQCAIPGQKLP